MPFYHGLWNIAVLSIKGSGTPRICKDTEGRTVLTPAEFQGELDITCKPPLVIGQCKVLAPWHQAHCLSIPPVASGFLIHDWVYPLFSSLELYFEMFTLNFCRSPWGSFWLKISVQLPADLICIAKALVSHKSARSVVFKRRQWWSPRTESEFARSPEDTPGASQRGQYKFA